MSDIVARIVGLASERFPEVNQKSRRVGYQHLAQSANGHAPGKVDEMTSAATVGSAESRRDNLGAGQAKEDLCPYTLEPLAPDDAVSSDKAGMRQKVVNVPVSLLVCASMTTDPCLQTSWSKSTPYVYIIATRKSVVAMSAYLQSGFRL